MNHREQRADTVLAQAVESGRLANVVAMAASEDEVIYSGAYGLIDSTRSIELDSIFRLPPPRSVINPAPDGYMEPTPTGSAC